MPGATATRYVTSGDILKRPQFWCQATAIGPYNRLAGPIRISTEEGMRDRRRVFDGHPPLLFAYEADAAEVAVGNMRYRIKRQREMSLEVEREMFGEEERAWGDFSAHFD